MSIKHFSGPTTIEELNSVNDAQKSRFQLSLEQTGDAAEAAEQRRKCYRHRWQEALPYTSRGDTVLDIGSGWPIERIFDLVIRDSKLDYYALDISKDQIEATKVMLLDFGLPIENAVVSTNTEIPFPDSKFDFVFSSHCLEHSPDLTQTLKEIRRVLKPDGVMFFAVPPGFDDSDEHLMFLDTDDWTEATQLAGFDILNVHIGYTYPQSGWDLCVVARMSKNRPFNEDELRLLANRRSKIEKTFVPGIDPLFVYYGKTIHTGRHKVLASDRSSVVFNIPNVETLLFHQDEWCGVAEVSTKTIRRTIDTYSRHSTVGSLDVSDLAGQITVRSIGSSKGKSTNIVLHGALLTFPPSISEPTKHRWSLKKLFQG
jgi:SAM-dependent methyltransferase